MGLSGKNGSAFDRPLGRVCEHFVLEKLNLKLVNRHDGQIKTGINCQTNILGVQILLRELVSVLFRLIDIIC